jgi:putative transposase
MEIGPMKKRYSEEQIIGFLREVDDGLPVKELCRKHGFSEPSYYAWKAKFGGMNISDAQRLKALEAENSKLKRLLANSKPKCYETWGQRTAPTARRCEQCHLRRWTWKCGLRPRWKEAQISSLWREA